MELQNGCLSLGHAHTFIPSILGGSCYNQQTGEIDDEKLCRNVDLAIEAYISISRVNQCSCGDTCIHLFRGADADDHCEARDSLLTFLKGSKQQRILYVERNHSCMLGSSLCGMSAKNIWLRDCLLRTSLCSPAALMKNVHILSARKECLVKCPDGTKMDLQSLTFHFLWLMLTDHGETQLAPLVKAFVPATIGWRWLIPLTSQLRSDFSKLSAYPPSETFVKEEAEKVLLTPDDTKIWMDHLNTVLLNNRKRGAAKAAAARHAKKSVQEPVHVTSQATTYCGGCGKPYVEETEEVEIWICCDLCNQWYCGECENLQSPPTTDYYFCKKCC